MALQLPAPLLRQLVDEWERITKQSMLPPLPRRPAIDALLGDYLVRTLSGSQGIGFRAN